MRLQRLFDDAKLPALFLKGPPLAVLAFGNLGIRQSKDLDLLVPRAALPAAITIIERAGYRRVDPAPTIGAGQLRLLESMRKDFGFANEQHHLEIELHWRPFLNPHLMPDGFDAAAPHLVPLGNGNELRTLPDELLFSYLCGHGAQHSWHQLKWLSDVGALLAKTAPEDLCRTYRAAERAGAGRAAAQALLLCERVLGTNLPSELRSSLSRSITVHWLVGAALNAMTAGNAEIAPHNLRFGTTLGSLSSFLLGRSWQYKLAELKILLTSESDVLACPLPKWLQLLYPALRLPLWLWRQLR